MDPNTAMEAATEGAKALTKFQEIIEKIFGPRWTKKQADAEAYADEKKLQTIRDNPDMEIMYVDGKMHARERSAETLAAHAEQRALADAIRQENNIENVLDIAAQEVQTATAVSDKPIDDDWIIRLFSIVKDVNSEEMQYLWGKILAGEIIEPGSFSLRTLEAVRNLSRIDAETFQKILPFIICHGGTYFLLSDKKLLDKYGLHYSDFLLLDECGLVSSDGMLSLNLKLAGKETDLLYTDERLLIIENTDEGEKSVSISIFALTKVGVELYSILEHTPNNDYFLAFSKQVKEKHKDVAIKLTVHQINEIKEGTINYKLNPIESLQKEG